MSGSGRIVLIVVSPRSAPGLLAWPAWQALHAADAVFAANPDPVWLDALTEAGIDVIDLAGVEVGERAARLLSAASPGTSAATGLVTSATPGDAAPRQAVWFGSADGDPGLTDALAVHLSQLAVAAQPPELEVIVGSHDVPGARVLDLVAVMDRLRSPGGCPWDAEQTHASLLPYLLEEAHEVIEAVERPDDDPQRRAHLVEELGDLLLQVMFHARVGEERPEDPFDIDEVAAGIVEKLVRRHPHVFADVDVADAEQVSANWEQIKAAEKQREGVFDGIPASLPALARAQKMLGRLDEPDAVLADTVTDPLARALLDAVQLARRTGRDAEASLRTALNQLS
ncbi:MAG: MazG family protein [Kineosporiaceae bacterium]